MTRAGRLTELLRILRFGLVGGLATLIHLVVAQAALAAGTGPFTANIMGFVAGFVLGLAGHQYFTFAGSGTPFRRAATRYAVIACTGFAANNVILGALQAADWFPPAISLTIAILIIPAGTFIACRFWGFAPDGR